MATDIDEAFVRQYESEVHVAYQRMGTKLRSTVRVKNGVVGKSTTFQKVGKGVAVGKTRHGVITPMNLDHTPVEITLADWYAGDWVDKLDELKIQHDERKVIVDAGAFALGRKTDDMIIAALATTTLVVGDYTTPFTEKLVLDAVALAHTQEWPEDSNWFGVVAPHAWGELMQMDVFSDADFVGSDGLPWTTGRRFRSWLGINWTQHQALPLASTDDRDSFIYHRSAVGHAVGADVSSDITWHGDRAAHWINNMMSQGSGLIDGNGVIKIKHDDDTAYT